MKPRKTIGKSDLELTKTVTGDEILIRQNQDTSVSQRPKRKVLFVNGRLPWLSRARTCSLLRAGTNI